MDACTPSVVVAVSASAMLVMAVEVSASTVSVSVQVPVSVTSGFTDDSVWAQLCVVVGVVNRQGSGVCWVIVCVFAGDEWS